MAGSNPEATGPTIAAGNKTDSTPGGNEEVLNGHDHHQNHGENNTLCTAQHGSHRHRSTASVNLSIKNALESALEIKTCIYGSSWDISKAFVLVSKDMIRLAWEKLTGDSLVRQDEVLLKIHHAHMAVPNRSKVVEALKDTLLGAPPTFEEYLQAVRSRQEGLPG